MKRYKEKDIPYKKANWDEICQGVFLQKLHYCDSIINYLLLEDDSQEVLQVQKVSAVAEIMRICNGTGFLYKCNLFL